MLSGSLGEMSWHNESNHPPGHLEIPGLGMCLGSLWAVHTKQCVPTITL